MPYMEKNICVTDRMEKNICVTDRMGKFICVTNRSLVRGDFLSRLGEILENGSGALPAPDAVILREKDLTEEEYRLLAEKVREICCRAGVPLILNTFTGAARALGIRSIQLPVRKLDALSDKEKADFNRIGASVHTPEEAGRAADLGASYVTAGHIFATDCKKGLPPRGMDFLKACCARSSVPVYAIGGIGPDNFQACLDAGASGVCIMSGYMRTEGEGPALPSGRFSSPRTAR